MIILCKYNQDGRCRCSRTNMTVQEFCKEHGWICGKDCPFCVSVYTESDRDKYLMACIKRVKKDSVTDLCVNLWVCAHRANSRDDQYAILYDACIIRLIQKHERKKLVDSFEFCRAYEQAKRLGIRLPGRSRKIYHRLKPVLLKHKQMNTI